MNKKYFFMFIYYCCSHACKFWVPFKWFYHWLIEDNKLDKTTDLIFHLSLVSTSLFLSLCIHVYVIKKNVKIVSSSMSFNFGLTSSLKIIRISLAIFYMASLHMIDLKNQTNVTSSTRKTIASISTCFLIISL